MIILEELDTEFGHIKVTRSKRDGTCTYYQGECFHSQINADGISTCAYVHIMYSLIRQASAQRVLMIGCAGGTLATMLYRAGMEVTVVDVNPHAFVLAQRHFQMPSGVECIVQDGWQFLEDTPYKYDAIAIDAFASDATIPSHFTTEAFFRLTASRLTAHGILLMNVMGEHDLDRQADRLALNLASTGISTILFDWPTRENRNAIIAGGAIEQLHIPGGGEPPWILPELLRAVRREPKAMPGEVVCP